MNEEQENFYPEYFSAPVEMIWELTGKCACHCMYCGGDFPCVYSETELTSEQRFELANELISHKLFTINLSGGEPFFCEDLYPLAKMFTDAGIHTSINTAGYNADDEVVQKLCSLDNLAFCISIDSVKEEINDTTRGKEGALKTALSLIDRIQLFSKNRIPIIVECVLSTKNIDEIDSMIDFFYKKGISQIRFQQVVVSGRAYKNMNEISLLEGVLIKELVIKKRDEFYKKCMENNQDLSMEIHFVDQSLLIKTGINRGLNWGGIIGPTGTLKPCAYLDFETDSYRNYGSFMNLWNSGYNIVWKDPKIVEICKSVSTIWDIYKLKKDGKDVVRLSYHDNLHVSKHNDKR